MSDLATRSQELFGLYDQVDSKAAEDPAEVVLRGGEEARYAASQWRLMWRNVIRNRAAVAGGIVILMFYLSVLFANFIVPYRLDTRHRNKIYMPPQRVHLFHDGRFEPFVYATKLTIDKKTLRKVYAADLN